MKGAASSRAVLTIVGGIMTVMALGAGISPLMNMLGVAEQSTDTDKLSRMAEAVRQECTQAENNNIEYATEFTVEFKSIDEVTVADNGESLEATFESDNSPWKSDNFKCQLEIDNSQNSITEGEWSIEIKGVESENPKVRITPEQQ